MNKNLQAISGLKKVTAFSILAIALFCCTAPNTSTAITWQHYDRAVLDRARQEGRPVILDFFADWCIPCHQLDRFTFSDGRVIESSQQFVMVKVDLTDYESPEAEQLRTQFGVTGVPEVLFLDVQGNEIQELRVIGYLGPDDFLPRIKLALEVSSSSIASDPRE